MDSLRWRKEKRNGALSFGECKRGMDSLGWGTARTRNLGLSLDNTKEECTS